MANSLATLRISRFGPPMTGSCSPELGMLSVACDLIETRLLVSVQLTNISLRLQPNENLQEVLLKSRADYIVLESAPVDMAPIDMTYLNARTDVPLARLRLAKMHDFAHLGETWGRLKNQLLSMIDYLAGVDPITPMLEYLAAIALIASACKSAGVTAVVVLTPIVRDFRCSAASVVAYKNALRDLAKVQGILLVDCDDASEARAKSLALGYDRGYLSPTRQGAAGRAIADSIVSDILTRPRRFEPSTLWST